MPTCACGKECARLQRGACGTCYMRWYRSQPRDDRTPEQKFWDRVERTDTCWNWTGRTDHGYGRVQIRGAEMLAHRVAWLLSGRQLDPALELDHLCRNHGCVNPDHLEQVTHAENVRRGAEARTECRNGHSYAAENRGPVKNGQRRCLACHRDGARRAAARARARLLTT